METITLTRDEIDEIQIRQQIIDPDQRIVATAQLQMSTWSGTQTISVLNDPAHLQRLSDPNRLRRQLSLHGLHWVHKTTPLREYKILVFQTNVLGTYATRERKALIVGQRRQARDFYRVRAKTKEIQRMHEIAIRTIYALGLDYGFVTCGVGPGKRSIIIQINVRPKLEADLQKAFINEFIRYMREISSSSLSTEVKLGADPEFVVQTKQGSLLIASNYFPLKGKVGCDAIWIGQNRKDKPLIEIRPEPSLNPRTVALRIYEGLLHVAKKVNHVSGKWLAGNMPVKGFPLGGHIHFSGIKPNFEMLRALDNYLTLPFVVIEDERGSKRRPKYGFLGDFRKQPHGGFEYRTPPSWLISPILTKGALALAKCIVCNYQQLQYNPLADPEVQMAYYQGDKQKIHPWINLLWSDITSLKDYQQYSKYLDDFFRYLQNGKKWNESIDIRKAWRIPPFHSGNR
ncbi:Phage phiEco32-like COOH.NH2 ligase-type 2 [Seinonella peptonophila]|uniref:Phage phiEco32-like COOH.NH2 ligase-type 2 n=1 Tax=Seinonella peptonophila TaxID=112248 RepID=A0A1M4T266_9BACL|nr:hypothetical protein [Seinonella peptonophila]SHE38569.1 Phage phiEco32-like COOH.NH2 ligase-type 2 [Seinonella peptonophila]